jgi:hypothetical protein
MLRTSIYLSGDLHWFIISFRVNRPTNLGETWFSDKPKWQNWNLFWETWRLLGCRLRKNEAYVWENCWSGSKSSWPQQNWHGQHGLVGALEPWIFMTSIYFENVTIPTFPKSIIFQRGRSKESTHGKNHHPGIKVGKIYGKNHQNIGEIDGNP